MKVLIRLSMNEQIDAIAFSSQIKKITEKESLLCVIGLGQVGLTAALAFLTEGFKVVGYDVNERLVQDLLNGITHIPEKGFKELVTKFQKDNTFTLTTSPDVLSRADIIIICVPTPLDFTGLNADLTYLKKALEDVSKHLADGKLIIIESTIPPRTMKEFVIPTMEDLSGKKAGKEFLISFCPERMAPGNALQEYRDNAKIIGANDNASSFVAFSLLNSFAKGNIYQVDTTTAEISKLAENSYRDVNIAFANELATICEQSKVDVMEVIKLANTHPRVNIHRPGPGVGGPCLPKDPYLLIMGKQYEKSIIKIAREINDSMPEHVADTLVRNTKFIDDKSKANLRIGILGVSYKSNVNDSRYSPTAAIISALRRKGFTDITIHDPYSNELFGAKFSSDLYSVLHSSDCLIIATAHSIYSSIRINDFKEGSVIIDAVRILDKRNFSTDKLTYVALGA
jgi:UDP-N-acetyl-D-mannosaminuronic acid dehydrogenase